MTLLKGQRDWLIAESERWVGDGLISAAQAEAIRARYPSDAGIGIARSLFAGFGIVLVGLGVILFFAWNWDALHRLAKLGLLFSALIAAHAGGQFWLRPGSPHPRLGEALALLGTLLFGAGIWLISQVYHIDEHAPNGVLAWGLAALAMAWALPSRWQGLLAAVLLTGWGMWEATEFSSPHWAAPLYLLVLLALGLRLRAVVLSLTAVVGFLLLLAVQWEHVVQRATLDLLYACGVACIAVASLFARRSEADLVRLKTAFAVPGFVVVLVLVFFLSFKDSPSAGVYRVLEPNSAGQLAALLLALSAAFALVAYALAPRSRPPAADAAHIALAALGLLLFEAVVWGYGLTPRSLSWYMNFAFAGHALLFIWHGSQVQRGGIVAWGCLLFAALVFARYFDLFESLLVRSAVFIALGIGLFAVGQFYARQRRAEAAA